MGKKHGNISYLFMINFEGDGEEEFPLGTNHSDRLLLEHDYNFVAFL